MKKILAMASMLVVVFALAACGPAGTLTVDSDSDGIHAVATGTAQGSANASITIPEGYGLCINHIVEKGSFHVKAVKSGTDTLIFDSDITDNVANFVDVVPGDYDLVISADNATGTIDVIPYDKVAQAKADGTLDAALQLATGLSADDVGLTDIQVQADERAKALEELEKAQK